MKLCFESYPELRDEDIKVVYDDMPFCADVEGNEIPIEIFAFFHEVGHVFHNYMYYTFYEDCINEYINLNEGDFRCYRDIYYEYLADIFATDMILNYKKEILNIIK